MTMFQAFTERVRVLKRSINIRNNLGTRCAAGYLRNQAVEFEVAHQVLLGYAPRLPV